MKKYYVMNEEGMIYEVTARSRVHAKDIVCCATNTLRRDWTAVYVEDVD